MRYILILNPETRGYNGAQLYATYLKRYFETNKLNYKIYTTKFKGEATEIVSREASVGDDIRVYGFGGDGTLNEIANGAINNKNVEIGMFAFGSGNDFIRTFNDNEQAFKNIKSQLTGKSIFIDAIKSDKGMISVNQASIGIDAKVAMNVEKFKNLPLVNGSLAYNLSLLKCVIFSGLSVKMEVIIDNEKRYFDDFMFVLAGNGKYYGGGYKGAPNAIANDGKLEFILMKKINKVKFAKIRKIYKEGNHLVSPAFENKVIYEKGNTIEIKTLKPVVSTFDGECQIVTNLKLEVVPNCLRFIVPNEEEKDLEKIENNEKEKEQT